MARKQTDDLDNDELKSSLASLQDSMDRNTEATIEGARKSDAARLESEAQRKEMTAYITFLQGMVSKALNGKNDRALASGKAAIEVKKMAGLAAIDLKKTASVTANKLKKAQGAQQIEQTKTWVALQQWIMRNAVALALGVIALMLGLDKFGILPGQ